MLLTIPIAVGRRFLSHHGFMLAGALSYSLLICLAPLVLLLCSAAGFVISSDQITRYVVDSVTDLFPGAGPDLSRLLVLLVRERQVAGLIGIAGLLVTSTQLFSLIRTVTNVAFEVTRRRGPVRGFALDILFAGLLGLLAVMVATGLIVVLTLADVGLGVLPNVPLSAWFRRAAVIHPVLLFLLFVLYRRSPNVTVPPSAAAAATVAVAVLWETARWLLTGQLAHFARYGRLYGSLGVAIAALVWIYYSAIMFVLGAELAAVLADRRRGRG